MTGIFGPIDRFRVTSRIVVMLIIRHLGGEQVPLAFYMQISYNLICKYREFDCKTCSFEEERVSACGTKQKNKQKQTRASLTDLGSSTLKAMEFELNRLTVENMTLREIVAKTNISEEIFKNDDEKVRLYTGLPSFVVLMTLFNFIEPDLTQSANSALSKFQKVILVLMRLKLNLSVQYLVDQFKVSQGTVSKAFLNTLNVMYVKLKPLIYWPSQVERRLTLPMEFRKYFGLKIAVIIDFFEIFIERPSNLVACAQTWSSYKHHNAVKYLIGISPPRCNIIYKSMLWLSCV